MFRNPLPSVFRRGDRSAQPARALSVVVLLGCLIVAARLLATLGTDDVRWFLRPSVALVELVTPTEFEWEAGFGYLARHERFVVTRDCAGLNFFLVSAGLLMLRRLRSGAGSRRWFAGILCCATLAWGAATLANSARIAGALWLRQWDWRMSAWTFDEAHQVESIFVYLVALAVFIGIVRPWRSASPGVVRTPWELRGG